MTEQRIYYVVKEVSPGRFGYELKGGYGIGFGYTSPGAAEVAAVQAIARHRKRIVEDDSSIRNHFDEIL